MHDYDYHRHIATKHAQHMATIAVVKAFPQLSEKEKREEGRSCEIDIYEEYWHI